jgi:uncharacterized glyoxalase superfamily protein PhnB
MINAFNAIEMGQATGEDGAISQAEVRVGDSVVMMFDSKKEWPGKDDFMQLS